MDTLIRACILALIIGGIAAVLIHFIVNRAPAPVPEWAKWLGRIVIVLLALMIFLNAMGWSRFSAIR